jgi:DTW domain-containing protein YfiP
MTILDVGSGVGKFCMTAAREVETATFVGVEWRAHLVEVATQLAALGGLVNVRFVFANAFDLDWSAFDGFYLYNPFAEHLFGSAFRLDHAIDFDRTNFARYASAVQHRLAKARIGTRIVTYHGFGAPLPAGYDLAAEESVGRERGWRTTMSRRENLARCATCRMHETLCICALVPRLRTRTRLTVLVHYREARKPTNTGVLAARCLERSTVEIVGQRDRLIEAPVINEEQPLLLFPAADAVPIEQFAASELAIALFVPDGNWRQASKMRRRGPGLAAIPCVTLPDTGPTEYRLRAEPRSGGLATLEAIARSLRVLEGDGGAAIEDAMLAVFRVMVERTLWFRGKLRDHEVTGGIPPAALADDPRGATTRETASTRER